VSRSSSKSLKQAGIQPGQSNPNIHDKNRGYDDRDMYSSLVLENFRGFERLELNDLGQINLLFGPNNSGKTTVLEAVYTHAAGLNFQPFFANAKVDPKVKTIFCRQ
jgi:predicted ATPase